MLSTHNAVVRNLENCNRIKLILNGNTKKYVLPCLVLSCIFLKLLVGDTFSRCCEDVEAQLRIGYFFFQPQSAAIRQKMCNVSLEDSTAMLYVCRLGWWEWKRENVDEKKREVGVMKREKVEKPRCRKLTTKNQGDNIFTSHMLTIQKRSVCSHFATPNRPVPGANP